MNGDIFKDIEQTYREKPNFGVTFGLSMDESNYAKPKGVRVAYGTPCEIDEYCSRGNFRRVIINHHFVGFLVEYIKVNYFHPICNRFEVFIHTKDETDAIKKNPHYNKIEGIMQFATLQQMIDFLNIKPYVKKKIKK